MDTNELLKGIPKEFRNKPYSDPFLGMVFLLATFFVDRKNINGKMRKENEDDLRSLIENPAELTKAKKFIDQTLNRIAKSNSGKDHPFLAEALRVRYGLDHLTKPQLTKRDEFRWQFAREIGHAHQDDFKIIHTIAETTEIMQRRHPRDNKDVITILEEAPHIFARVSLENLRQNLDDSPDLLTKIVDRPIRLKKNT